MPPDDAAHGEPFIPILAAHLGPGLERLPEITDDTLPPGLYGFAVAGKPGSVHLSKSLPATERDGVRTRALRAMRAMRLRLP